MHTVLQELQASAANELTGNILPFWINRMTDKKGGYFGRMDGRTILHEKEERGGILNARILWSFSAAFHRFPKPEYEAAARHALSYLLDHFFDPQFGGTFWKVDADGNPSDTKKQIYSQAFFIYALVEYYMAFGDKTCLEKAIALFHLIEDHSYDPVKQGYFEAYSRDWKLLEDLRLSEKDDNEKKTTNTHLHILEAYTSLFHVWKDPQLENRLRDLVILFRDTIIDPVHHHMKLFFDEDWNSKSTLISYGHDIEASWLVYEGALALKDEALLISLKEPCVMLGQAALEGLQPDGSLVYEEHNGQRDMDRHWWPQAEAVVGLLNLFQLTGRESFLEDAHKCWKYIEDHLVDRKAGEWYWSIRADGSINTDDDRAGFWKCPYHNTRACLKAIGYRLKAKSYRL